MTVVANLLALAILSVVFWVCIATRLWFTAAAVMIIANLYLLGWFRLSSREKGES